MTIRWETTIVLTPQFRLLPYWSRDNSRWPRVWRFHWLFLCVQGEGRPA